MSEGIANLRVQEHTVRLKSMSTTTRVFTGLGIGQMAIGILMLLLRDVPFPTIIVGMVGDTYLTVGVPFLFLTSFLMVSAWAFTLTGALQARWWLAFFFLAMMTIVMWRGATADSGWPIASLSLIAIWVYFLVRKIGLRRLPIVVDFLVIAALGGLFNLATIVMSLSNPSPYDLLIYSLSITDQVLMLTFFLMPALVLAGLDLGELSQQTSQWVSDKITTFVPLPVAAGFIVVAAAAKVVLGVAAGFRPGVRVIPSFAVILGIGLLSFLLRKSGRLHYEPPFWLLFVLSCLLFVVLLSAVIANEFLPKQAGSIMTFVGASMTLMWFITGFAAASLASLLFFTMRLLKRRAGTATLFLLIYGIWIIVAIGSPRILFQMVGLDVAGIWPLVILPDLDVAASITAAVLTVFFMATRSLNREKVAILATLLLTFTIVSVFYSLYEQETQMNDLLVLVQAALLLVVPVTALVAAFHRPEAAVRRRRLLAVTLGLGALIGIVAIAGLIATSFHLFPGGLALPKDSAALIVLAVALPWDFVMSGSRFTNHDGRRFPRVGRLLFYLGYVSLFCAALVWLKCVQNQDPGIFDESIWPFYGLLSLGWPVIFCTWIFAARNLWPGAQPISSACERI
ncbi:MAG: hypothetical protein Q7O66_09415 [Dehalococcoidia bacterium]|nr:hypothetical protein [Dehalococcoidia bacterium]